MSTPADHPLAGLEPYVDAKTAAARLNLPVNAIYRLIESGKLPALLFPVRIRSDDVATVLDRCRVKPGELSHLNQYAGRPRSGVAGLFHSKPRVRHSQPTF